MKFTFKMKSASIPNIIHTYVYISDLFRYLISLEIHVIFLEISFLMRGNRISLSRSISFVLENQAV